MWLNMIAKKKNFDDFKSKFTNYSNIFSNYENFNSTFLNQLEAKSKQSGLIRSSLEDPQALNKLVNDRKIIRKKINKKLKTPYLFKMKYYNSVLMWDHIKQNLIRITEFKDRFDFKLNYQVYSGNIFLNHSNRLMIITGVNFNMFYFYDFDNNEIYRLPSLVENHCRGGLVYVERTRSLLCLSGKYSNICEKFYMKYCKFPKAPKDKKATIESLLTEKKKRKKKTKKKKSEEEEDQNEDEGANEEDDYGTNEGNNENENEENENKPEVKKETIDPSTLNYMENDKLKWETYPSLNITRHSSSFFIYNEKYLMCSLVIILVRVVLNLLRKWTLM